ncbi:MAG: DNA repair protein RecO [Elainellaceae cyanobacterium]
MSKTYTATGINLKSIPFGENDRLLTILTPEFGIVRAVAPGARKHKSSLRGRSGLFVVNELLIIRGRSLDKVIQAESVTSFSGLSQDLGKLTAGQYIAELVLFQALAQHPQQELYALVCDYLARLESELPSATLGSLVETIYGLLAYGGLAPQVFQCCATQRTVQPDFDDSQWRVEFDATAGGIVLSLPPDPTDGEAQSAGYPADEVIADDSTMDDSTMDDSTMNDTGEHDSRLNLNYSRPSTVAYGQDYRAIVRSPASAYPVVPSVDAQPYQNGGQQNLSQNLPNVRNINRPSSRRIELITQLTAAELAALQWIAQADQQRETMQSLDRRQLGEARSFEKASGDRPISHETWLSLERTLRHYAQYHFDQSIRSAALIETCFLLTPPNA